MANNTYLNGSNTSSFVIPSRRAGECRVFKCGASRFLWVWLHVIIQQAVLQVFVLTADFFYVLLARRGTSVAPPMGHRINLMGHGDVTFQYVLVKYAAEVQH